LLKDPFLNEHVTLLAEWNEYLEERLTILEEAKKLKQVATYYYHPELPVTTTPGATARCYFDRCSAAPQVLVEDTYETILSDLQTLKKFAADYLHPELPVVTSDPMAFGRNYFARGSAPAQEDPEDETEREQIFADLKALKQTAMDYLHPERPVVTKDATACGRNYFTRPSAPQQERPEDEAERQQIFADLKALRQSAVDYMHPERTVITTDVTACGRNYFARASAPRQEDLEDEAEREQIFADLKALKQTANDYLHPERPVVTTDATACGRNYFTRAFAPQQEDIEDEAEREQIFADLKALKLSAGDYMHPERPVVTADPMACGRNYFTRASAPHQESIEDEAERAQIFSDLKALKLSASDYMHPEVHVNTSDPTAGGRNYFNRASAKGQNHMIHTMAQHPDDQHHDDHHHEHLDQFGMDEDVDMMFADMKAVLYVPSAESRQLKNYLGEEDTCNLSRSPSSVMLFSEGETSA
jgi:predicted Rdx family selenoprotein